MIDTDKLKAAALIDRLRAHQGGAYSSASRVDIRIRMEAANYIEDLERKLAEAERHRAELSGVLRAVHEAAFGYGQWPSEQVIREVLEGTPVEAERRQVPEWISVEENAPPIGENIRFKTRAGNTYFGWKTVDEDYWVPELNTWIGGDGTMVTHWIAAAPEKPL